jgi:hypothetical protein
VIPLFLALVLTGPAQQQPPPFEVPPAHDGRRLAVYLVTFGPGPQIWERFGHNAILIRDTVTSESVAYDYGRFSFEEKRFFIGFARGRMQYWMGREDGVALLNSYIRRQRSAWMQQLALPPADRIRLRELLEADYEHDRGRYRYDYYRDNCSTRLRDAIDSVIGGAIRARLDTAASGVSYRWHTRRSLENNLINWFGVDAGLGPAADLPVSRYQETFLPLMLRDYIRGVMIAGPDGQLVPLVKGELALAESDLWPVANAPTDWTLQFLLAGAALGGILLLLGRAAPAGWTRMVFGGLAGLWALFAAVGGAVLVFLAFFSEHAIAFRNENLWQFNLLAVVLLPVLPGALRGEKTRGRVALALAWLVAVGSLAGLAMQGLPGRGQANGEIIALALPLHLGLAAGLTAAVRSRSRAPS